MSEFTFVDNKDKRSIALNRDGRSLKRSRTESMTLNSLFRTDLLTLNYFLISSSLFSLSTTQDASERRQNDVNSDLSKDSLLENLLNDFFANINVDDLFFNPYSGSPQPLIRLLNFVVRHSYINESKRHYLNLINNVCTRYDATL